MSVVEDTSPIKIGVLFSETGVTAVVERTQRNAVLLAVEEINSAGGIHGRPLEIVTYDPGSNPKQFQAYAKKLLSDDGVRTIFGCYMSSTRKAVLPVVEQYQGLLFYPTLYEGFEFSPNCIYSGAAPNQNIVGLGRYLMEKYGDRFYLVGSNYVYPYETNRIMRDYIVAHRGQVFEERYIPLKPSDDEVRAVIDDIRKYGDATIISTVVGDGTAKFYQEYRRAGFDPNRMPIGSLTTGEPEIAAMGKEAAEGHVTSAPYFQSVSTVENERFVEAYSGRFGSDAPVSACSEAAYLQIHLFARAVERCGSSMPEEVKGSLPGCEYAAPQGQVRIDGENNHTYLWPRIGQVDCHGNFEIKEESLVPVKPDPYLIMPEDESWATRTATA